MLNNVADAWHVRYLFASVLNLFFGYIFLGKDPEYP